MLEYILVMNNHNFIYDGNELLGFGNNGYGQLGLSDDENRNKPTLVMRDKTIQQIVCGGSSYIYLKRIRRIICFWL